MFVDPIKYQEFERDPVLKEIAQLAARERKRLLPFLLVDDPSDVSGYHMEIGGSVYDMPRLRRDACLDMARVADLKKERFGSVVVECKRQIGQKAGVRLEEIARAWNDWALAASVVRAPAEMSLTGRSVEMSFPQLLERREDAVAGFVVLVNMIAREIAGKTIYF